jgi:hypothetical protein
MKIYVLDMAKTRIRRRHKTTRTTSKHALFNRYDKGHKGYLTLPEFKKLLKETYCLSYTSHIMGACYATWFTNKRLQKAVFLKMYKAPDGFLRDRD